MENKLKRPGDQARGGKSKCCSTIVILNQAELKCHNCGKAHTSSFGIACSYACYTKYQESLALQLFYQGMQDWRHTRPSSAPDPQPRLILKQVKLAEAVKT
jgi:hypothetical protein